MRRYLCVCGGIGVYEGGEEIIVCMRGCRGCMKGVYEGGEEILVCMRGCRGVGGV